MPEVSLLEGTIAGADDFVELALWSGGHLAFLRRVLPYTRSVPSHHTLCEVVAALDPELFKACFANLVERLRSPAPGTPGVGAHRRKVIAIDGKTSRRNYARSKGHGRLHTVAASPKRAAFVAGAIGRRLVPGQEAVLDKSNEITAIPLLLQRLELASALITTNAMSTQTAFPQAILDRGGGGLLALKGNRPETFASVEELFASLLPRLAIEAHEAVDGGHSRVERRRFGACQRL